MMYALHRLIDEDGSWRELTDQWGQLAADFGENFGNYALDAMPVLRELAHRSDADAGVYALRTEEGTYEAVAQAHSTFLPGYTGRVLRIRHLLLSPRFDYAEYEVEDYARVLGRMFTATVGLAAGELPSQHVKFHARSPADRLLFHAVEEPLRQAGIYADVAMKGSWFYLSLQPAGHTAEGDVHDEQP